MKTNTFEAFGRAVNLDKENECKQKKDLKTISTPDQSNTKLAEEKRTLPNKNIFEEENEKNQLTEEIYNKINYCQKIHKKCEEITLARLVSNFIEEILNNFNDNFNSLSELEFMHLKRELLEVKNLLSEISILIIKQQDNYIGQIAKILLVDTVINFQKSINTMLKEPINFLKRETN